MAAGKNSFIAYTDWRDTFDALPDDKAGQLIKHIFAYVNDEDPQTDDVLIKAVFAGIRRTLKRDLKKYDARKDAKIEGGKYGNLKRWHPDLYDKVKSGELSLDDAYGIAYRSHTDRNGIGPIAVSVSVSDSVSDIKREITRAREFCREMYEDEQWQISVRQVYPRLRKADNITKALNHFVSFCESSDVAHKDLKDAKGHFIRWMKHQSNTDIPGMK